MGGRTLRLRDLAAVLREGELRAAALVATVFVAGGVFLFASGIDPFGSSPRVGNVGEDPDGATIVLQAGPKAGGSGLTGRLSPVGSAPVPAAVPGTIVLGTGGTPVAGGGGVAGATPPAAVTPDVPAASPAPAPTPIAPPESTGGESPAPIVPASLDTDGDTIPDVDEAVLGTSKLRADSDDDGMPDGWEVTRRLDPLQAGDSQDDEDGDGVRNVNEFRAKSEPFIADSNGDGTPDGRDDADGDGVTNASEDKLGDDPGVADTNGDGRPDGADDADGDGVPNAAEDTADTDPAVADQPPPPAEPPPAEPTPPPAEEPPAPPVEEPPTPPADPASPVEPTPPAVPSSASPAP